MNKILLGLSPFLLLCGCADPEPVYIDRPVVVHREVRHVYVNRHSDAPEDFRAIERPTTYSQ